MAIRIITDTSSDVSIEESKELNVEMLPLTVSIGSNIYKDKYDLTTEEFYTKMKESKELPKTSQASPSDILDVFKSAKEANDDVITLFISTKLSGTYNTAVMLKDQVEYESIYNVSTLNTVASLRVIVLEAVKLRDMGLDAKTIVNKLNEFIPKVRIYGCIDNLENLYKGGRLSKVSMLVGNLLRLKPLITFIDGGIKVLEKSRGVNKMFDNLIEIINKTKINRNYPIYYLYCGERKNMDILKERMKNDYSSYYSEEYNISGVVGAHIGLNGSGIVLVEE